MYKQNIKTIYFSEHRVLCQRGSLDDAFWTRQL